MTTVFESLAIAVQHHQAGRLQAAAQLYQQILAVNSNHVDALHLLGVIAHQMGNQLRMLTTGGIIGPRHRSPIIETY